MGNGKECACCCIIIIVLLIFGGAYYYYAGTDAKCKSIIHISTTTKLSYLADSTPCQLAFTDQLRKILPDIDNNAAYDEIPAVKELYNHFSHQHSSRPPFSEYYIQTFLPGNYKKASKHFYSLVGNLSIPLNHYNKHGIFGFLNPNTTSFRGLSSSAPRYSSPFSKSEHLEIFKEYCKHQKYGILALAQEMHSALTKGCSPNSTYSISEIDRIIDEFPACPKRTLDTGCYRKRIAAHEMKENATRLEKYIMARKCCSVEHNGEHELLGKEELPCLVDLLPGYDRQKFYAFVRDVQVDMTQLLFNSLLCASVDDNLKEDAGAAVNITRRTAAFLSTHLPMKLGQSESVEESVARAIALKHSYVPFLFRDRRTFNGLVTPAAVLQMLKEISKNLENIGSENIDRGYVALHERILPFTLPQWYAAGRNFIYVDDIDQVKIFMFRRNVANAYRFNEFKRDAAAKYATLYPILTSDWKKDIYSFESSDIRRREFYAMLKKANISLIDGYISNTLIIEGRTSDGDCSFNQKRVLYNIDSSAVISYKISYEKPYLLPNVINLVIVDSWSSFKDHAALQVEVPLGFQVEIRNIPPGTTGMGQPLDVGYFRFMKTFEKKITKYVKLYGVDFPVHKRENLLRIHSVTHRHFSNSRFTNFILHVWKKSGFCDQAIPAYETPLDVCFPRFDGSPCAEGGCTEHFFGCCSLCNRRYCFRHFVMVDHTC